MSGEVVGDRESPNDHRTTTAMQHQLLNPGALHGTLHMVTVCMSENIAMSYEWIGTEDYIWFINFLPESACV
ncbi:MAG: hypothetical protein HC910_06875 [Spirulinaceae cyanobacterium SM2_1_0]|nr:hypothetical protein [Spirulinaceae cyanobacterium SM2_1_0]